MIDASAERRAARLRQIASVEIARHREAQGYLGAALEGSLATGAVWPSSDLDFTVVPLPEHSPERLIGWEQQEALPFPRQHPDQRLHIDICGQREGIPWHKHLTDRRALLDLVEGYPWGAYVAHLAGTLSLAPGQGHPAYVYQSLKSLLFWTTDYPDRMIGVLHKQDVSDLETLNQHACEVADLSEQIRAALLDPLQAMGRTRICLAAADQLQELTEARLQ